MRIISARKLRRFWEDRAEYADAQAPLLAWYREVRKAAWKIPADVKKQYRAASNEKAQKEQGTKPISGKNNPADESANNKARAEDSSPLP